MDMFNSHCLFAAPPQLGQGLHLHCECAGQLDRQIAGNLILGLKLGPMRPRHRLHGE
jgi:hypothetical protein